VAEPDKPFRQDQPTEAEPDPNATTESALDTETTTAPASPDRRVVDTAIYRHGQRVASPGSLGATYRALPEHPGAMAWIGLYRPSPEELWAAADQFGLHQLAVEDAIVAHQRPKLEQYGDTLFVVLRPARYLDETEEVELGELHLFIGPDFVLTVRHGHAPDIGAVRHRLEGESGLLAHGPQAVLYAVLDAVVDGYAPVIAGLQADIDQIETQVFGGDPGASRRTYELSREIIDLQRGTDPLLEILDKVAASYTRHEVDLDLQHHLRDVRDHATTVAERVSGMRQMITDILNVNATLVTQAQNEEMKRLTEASYAQNEEVKKVSSWAAILFAPTLIGTIYGMNFDQMPELRWTYGYPFALGLMVLVCLVLYVLFKRRNWL
jgi:magnesium transporter